MAAIALRVGLMFVVAFGAPRSVADGQSAQPFYLEQTQGARDGDTGVWTADFSSFVVARRADGTTVRIESRGPTPNQRIRMRDVMFADGRIVSVFDTLKLKTTWPAHSNEGLLLGTRLPDTSTNCTGDALDDLGQPFERTEGLDAIESQLVVVNTHASADLSFTSWRAPALACEELYYRAEELQADTKIVVNEKKTTRLVLGDPDPTLFAIDPTYKEAKPSEALIKLVSDTGLPLSDKERQHIIQEGADLDRRYQAKNQ